MTPVDEGKAVVTAVDEVQYCRYFHKLIHICRRQRLAQPKSDAVDTDSPTPLPTLPVTVTLFLLFAIYWSERGDIVGDTSGK